MLSVFEGGLGTAGIVAGFEGLAFVIMLFAAAAADTQLNKPAAS